MYIYALLDPISTLLVYVGKANNLKQRLGLHKAHSGPDGIAGELIRDYMGALTKRGLEPEIVTLEANVDERADAQEDYWMVQTFRSGAPLLNMVVPKVIQEEVWRHNRKRMKRCPDCGITKPNTLDNFTAIKMFDGLAIVCTACKEYNRRHRKK